MFFFSCVACRKTHENARKQCELFKIINIDFTSNQELWIKAAHKDIKQTAVIARLELLVIAKGSTMHKKLKYF